MSLALAIQRLVGRGELEQHALAQAAAADPQRLAQPAGGRLEHEDTGGQQAHPLRSRARDRAPPPPAGAPHSRAIARSSASSVEHGADQARQRRGAAPDRDRPVVRRRVELARTRPPRARARRRARAAPAGRRRRRPRAAAEPTGTLIDQPTPSVERPDRDLGRAAADVDDGAAADGRLGQRAGRAEEREARLVEPAEHGDVEPAASRRTAAHSSSRFSARRSAAVATALTRRAPARSATARCSSTTRATSAICGRARSRERVPRRGERAPLEDLGEPAAARVGDEHAGGVRADVDAGADHGTGGRSSQVGCHDRAAMTSDAPAPAIEVTGLRKAYDGLEALRGIAFEVARGEVFGLLGPNGAGKTTTVEILEGYRARSAGDVSVLGFDPGRAAGGAARARRDRAAELRLLPAPDRARGGRALGRRCIRRRASRPRWSRWSGSRRRPTGARACCRAASSGGWTSRWRWSAIRSSSSSTSRPPASIPRRGAPPGRRSARCATSARPCC